MGAWALLLLLLLAGAQAQVCSVNKTIFEIKENTKPSGPLVDIYVPEDQQVTLGPSTTPFAFRLQGNQLFLNVTPDYEENTMLLAELECKRGNTLVTPPLKVFVSVLDVNDNPPVFPFEVKVKSVPEDTKVNTIVIPEKELEAKDLDKNDILFYALQEVTPGARNFFSLVGANLPALRLDQPLDFDKGQSMTFRLLVRDTQEEDAVPSHTAMATLVLEVQPADLRPPWFLPCVYSDSHFCLQAQYHGAVPTGHRLPAPLILRPGPIYAVDGDRGINQPIIYSILNGNENSTFAINAKSGNLTMTRGIPSPKTFDLLVQAQQEDRARRSVTQVRVEARAAVGSLPSFSESLYRGTVALGSGVGVAVKDAAIPSQPLKIQAKDPEFPELNSAITYRVTNNSNFRMDGEAVLIAAPLVQAGVFYAEVEAKNTVTSGTATTAVEIEVSEQEPGPTGTPGSPTPPEAGQTTRPPSSSTPEVPRPPEPSQGPSTTSSGGSTGPSPPSSSTPEVPKPPKPSQGPSTTSSGGSTGPSPPSSSTPEIPKPPKPSQGPSTTSSGGSIGPQPPSGTTPKPPASSTPGGPSGVVTSTSPSSASSSVGSTPTSKPGSPGAGGGSGDDGQPGGHTGDRRFSAAEMAALGGVLGALLLLALIALVVLVHKHYGRRLQCCSGKAQEPQPSGFDNKAFLPDDQEAPWAPAPSPSPEGAPDDVPPAPPTPEPPAPPPPAPPSSPAPAPRVPESPAAREEGAGPGVRSILTKERRPEGGYKAVWFGESIGAEADVVVLNAPVPDADGASDASSDGSGDEGAPAGPGWGPRDDAPDADSTYI